MHVLALINSFVFRFSAFLIFILVLISGIQIFAQVSIRHEVIDWMPVKEQHFAEYQKVGFITFSNSNFDQTKDHLPLWISKEYVSNNEDLKVELQNLVYVPLTKDEANVLTSTTIISAEIIVKSERAFERKKALVISSFVPIRKNEITGQFEKVASFDMKFTRIINQKFKAVSSALNINESVLSSGDWYKIAVTENGVYKIDYNFLSSLGIDAASVNPQNIRIYGNGGGMLPNSNSIPRPDDLIENAIFVSGENDGIFDAEDYVLFYGMSPDTWSFDAQSGNYSHKIHLYSDSTYYFLNYDIGAGRRISDQVSAAEEPTNSITSFDDYAFHELENTNLISSGKNWYGEKFDIVTSYSIPFSFPGIDLTSPAFLKASVAARSSAQSSFTVQAGTASASANLSYVNTECYYCTYASENSTSLLFSPSSSAISVIISYNKANAASVGYLNYVELQVRRNLNINANQMAFRDSKTIGSGNVAEYVISGASSSHSVWEITDPYNVKNQKGTLTGSTYTFRSAADSLREYIVFGNTGFLKPVFSQRVLNQNLHALPQLDMLIVSHPKFMIEAKELADVHEQDGLTVEVVNIENVYNEFSSGAPDISAIRDFMRMFYKRAQTPEELPRYLLLVGDGSYDNRHNSKSAFILTYQSANSLSPTESYVSDDYFGLLDDSEGSWAGNNELVDIGIGRLPVRSGEEALVVVRKIKHYYSRETMKDWRNMVAFIADNGDGSLHVSQADQLANYISSNYKSYNVDKIYFDAYPLVSTPGGQRFPQVNEDIQRRVDKGALIVNYTGHGGEVGWAHERVLSIAEINSMNNFDNLPLFFTATCEFSRFDDHSKITAGESLLLNPNGGGIGLFTTVRIVYANDNFNLNTNFYKNVFKDVDGAFPRMGDVFRLTKVASGGGINNRNFTFLGDPALRLAYPYHDVSTATINGKDVATTADTVKALQKVTITGFVKNKSGQKLMDYNGVLYPTVYDKSADLKTLNQDPQSPVFSFKLQENVIYKGKASVKNGDFTFSFIVPKDIAYKFGKGRVSYYIDNGEEDGHGYFDEFSIGGSSDSIVVDNTGPEIKLYLNDDKFVFGGVTDEKPVLIAQVEDENGINTVGSGIGHDLTAILDQNSNETILLNEYYESDMDSYQKGAIRYSFSELEEGTHNLKVKVWDVYNNSGEAYTEFIVAKSAEIALDHVLNYPNPFTTNTQFFFEHNQSNATLDVQIQIYTLSGKIVKTINSLINTEGYTIEPINWNGLDDYNDRIGKGVYVYKLRVRTPDGKFAEKLEKLVILN